MVSRKRGTDNCSTNFKLNSTMAMPGGDLSYAQCPCPGHFSTPSVRPYVRPCVPASSALRRTITNNFSAFKHSSAKLINDISAKAHFNKYCQCARVERGRERRKSSRAGSREGNSVVVATALPLPALLCPALPCSTAGVQTFSKQLPNKND